MKVPGCVSYEEESIAQVTQIRRAIGRSETDMTNDIVLVSFDKGFDLLTNGHSFFLDRHDM